MNQPTLFDPQHTPPPKRNAPPPDPSMHAPPQVQARRDGQRAAAPLQGEFAGHIMGGLHGQPDGWDGDDVADHVSKKRGIVTARGSVCAVLKQLVDADAIWVKPERRLGRHGVKVTVYMHNRFRSDNK